MSRKLYPNIIERRTGETEPLPGQARRWYDKVFSFIFFLLLVFLVNWLVGCGSKQIQVSAIKYEGPVESSCEIRRDGRTCNVSPWKTPEELWLNWEPEKEPEYDDFEEVSDDDFN